MVRRRLSAGGRGGRPLEASVVVCVAGRCYTSIGLLVVVAAVVAATAPVVALLRKYGGGLRKALARATEPQVPQQP